ncbi:MAG: FAA hydrolase family protein [Rhodococcus sp. (in: high G+C Gram-positive bacteria)]|uniref:fumarylacetoacetate hydrolase family protein n=1 Tax=Rhodococcus sp. TaxID=1831 RepID=UPI0011FC7EF5|nr:fumarylacetoacetate hydrolase family protein [Rhodococcus sp. (in: high G+C Gram-positive bacteria)]RZL24642.1 MAG: FAA hydrolase family protein [Rhodococcus sp. (in: high G+C Gram-positive bacteria)]
MKLATLRRDGSTVAVRVDGNAAVAITPYSNVSELLRNPNWRALAAGATGPTVPMGDADYAPVVPAPTKIVCVGLNYANHIEEMGRTRPEYPTLFAKFPEALIGAHDNIEVPAYADQQIDWEGELAVVVGRTATAVSEDVATDYIAGYTVANDVSMRDYQNRTPQWLQGKTFEKTCPLGPVLVTSDEFVDGASLTTSVDGEIKQQDSTSDLVFTPAKLIEYISHIVTLQAGDVILTGTPGGVGHANHTYLSDGSTLVTSINGLGTLRNTVRVHATVPVN